MSKLSQMTGLDWYLLCKRVIAVLKHGRIDAALELFRAAGFDISDDIPG